MYNDYLTIILEDKIYAQRTPTSKFIEFDLSGTKVNTYNELPDEIKEIVNINKGIEENPSDYLEYEIINGEVCVKNVFPWIGTHIKIPEYIEDFPVTQIESRAFDEIKKQIKQIHLPNTIKEFKSQAFMNVNSLRHINIPQNITTIPRSCFEGCCQLNSIDLSNVTHIAASAFESCISLSTIDLQKVKYIDNAAFFDCHSLRTVKFCKDLLTLEQGAFKNCSSLNNITIPKTINEISNRVFENCHSLKNITLPDTLKVIGSYSFANTKLKNFIAPQNLEKIGSSAFVSTPLETIELNKKLKNIDALAFAECKKIKKIKIYDTTSFFNSSFPSKRSSNLEFEPIKNIEEKYKETDKDER